MASELDHGVIVNYNFTKISSEDNDDFFGDMRMDKDQETTIEELDEGLIYNPFFVSSDYKGLFGTSEFEIFSKFKRVIIICIKSGCNTPSTNLNIILNKVIKSSDLCELAKYYTLVFGSIKVLKNHFNKYVALLMDRHILNIFNSNNLELDTQEIVIPMVDIREESVSILSSMFEPSYTFDTLVTCNILSKYYKLDSYINIERISKLFYNIKEAEYWNNKYHCDINLTTHFKKRIFKYKEPLNANIKAAIIDKKDNIIEAPSNNKTEYNLSNIYRKTVYTDLSNAIRDKKYTLYKIDNNILSLTKEKVNGLFKSISDHKLLFNLFNTFVISKTHCHLVLNNSFVLEKMQPFFKSKYLAFYNYLFAYPWTCMYLEECIMKTRTTRENRFVFDIDTASKLPFFPYCVDNIHYNPYCVLAVDEKILKSNCNNHGLAMIFDYQDYGIDTLDGFKSKFNIFTSGKSDFNIFDGLETIPGTNRWKNFAISGSIMPACIPKRSPLIDIVTDPSMSFTDKMCRYFNEYYNESDIDVMCNSKSIFDFIDNISKLIEIVKNNLAISTGKDINIEIEPVKTLLVMVNTAYIEEQMGDCGSVNYVIKNIESPEIKEKFHSTYYLDKLKKNTVYRKEKGKNPLYEYFYKIVSVDDMSIMITSYDCIKNNSYESDSDTYIYLNDIRPTDKQVPENKNILVLKISENIKFKIRSEYLPHSLEIFRTRYEDYFSVVSKFHLPCVRSYYDGETVYMLPSCITAMMTMTNMDYKYFAGIRDPIDIISKYKTRGYGTLINETEKTDMVKYHSKGDKWGGMFTATGEMFGAKTLNDPIFKPNKYLKGYPEDGYKKIDAKYVLTIDNIYEWYKKYCTYTPETIDFIKLRPFNESGSIEPLKKWVLEASYDELY